MDGGLDSSIDRPGPDQARQAYAAGVRIWSGYLVSAGTPASVGLEAAWSAADFAVVRDAGLGAIAFCSGWDDPGALRLIARQLGLLLCLDCEAGIRGDGPWVGPFLEASGAGLYGNAPVHHWPAPFRILADYPGSDPGATWLGPAPPEPHGWQWQGTHQEFGLSVDRSWLDPWFYEVTMLLNEGMKIGLAHMAIKAMYGRDPTSTELFAFADSLNADGSNLNDLVQAADTTATNAAELVRIQGSTLADEVDALKAAGTVAVHRHQGGPTGPPIAG